MWLMNQMGLTPPPSSGASSSVLNRPPPSQSSRFSSSSTPSLRNHHQQQQQQQQQQQRRLSTSRGLGLLGQGGVRPPPTPGSFLTADALQLPLFGANFAQQLANQQPNPLLVLGMQQRAQNLSHLSNLSNLGQHLHLNNLSHLGNLGNLGNLGSLVRPNLSQGLVSPLPAALAAKAAAAGSLFPVGFKRSWEAAFQQQQQLLQQRLPLQPLRDRGRPNSVQSLVPDPIPL